MSGAHATPLRLVGSRRRPTAIAGDAVTLRQGTAADAEAIHALIHDNLVEGHLLPRPLAEIVERAGRFVVADEGGRVIACAELAPLSPTVAEIRSLVVSGEARGLGVSRRIVEELIRRASLAGFDRLCAFTHSPAYFVRVGFSMVPHVWLPEKIVTDCRTCVHFRRCGQYAVVHDLARQRDSCVPLANLHG